jgi:hypothetical protein
MSAAELGSRTIEARRAHAAAIGLASDFVQWPTSGRSGARRGRITAFEFWRCIGVPAWVCTANSRECGRAAGRVYFVEAEGSERIKIGWTSTDPFDRLNSLSTGSPFPLRMLVHLSGTQKTEGWLHAACVEARAHNEWFHATPELRELIGLIQALRPR